MSFSRARRDFSGSPLAVLPAVVLDTETTGLDTTQDRIVEIAAVRLEGTTEPVDRFARLLDPGVAIPASATGIHGIADADVEGAERFPSAMAALAAWVDESVVLGWSIGFDLAVLEAEHRRSGLAWTAPRSLDVRHLFQLVAPRISEPTLEMAAGCFGLSVSGRHRALGDALLTARVFQALLPLLREKEIATLAQAERACLALSPRLDDEARAGWHAAVGAGRGEEALFARIDSYPYRHRVADVMRVPPIAVAPDTRLRRALATMMEQRVSSVFVESANDGIARGILTERDVLRALHAEPEKALDETVDRHASWPLITVPRDEFVYRALTAMAGRGFRHLGVSDGEGRLVGALSARDLLRRRAGDAVLLGECIDQAEDAVALGRVWADLATVVRALFREQIDARDIAGIVSRELRALTSRACVLAEQDLEAAGQGPPPVTYAMLVLGSGGRGESLLAMDQDNAIVFAEGAPGSPADRWFAELGRRVSDMLNAAGVAYCKGGIMAMNTEWRRDRAGWREIVAAWMRRTRPQDILNSDIFFDAVPVHGDTALAEELLATARGAARGARPYLQAMALNAADFPSPLGWFDRIRLQDGRVDLKLAGLMPIFAAARIAALRHAISAHSTPERLRAVAAHLPVKRHP